MRRALCTWEDNRILSERGQDGHIHLARAWIYEYVDDRNPGGDQRFILSASGFLNKMVAPVCMDRDSRFSCVENSTAGVTIDKEIVIQRKKGSGNYGIQKHSD